MRTVERVRMGDRELDLSNLEKTLWPGDGLTKAHFISYLVDVAPWMLPHLRGRPLVLTRYPDGIEGESFYQKDCPDHAPSWVRTFPYWSRDSERWIRFVLCEDVATLAWLGNLACLELHPWLSGAATPFNPDLAVFDLDPAEPAGFEQARELAFLVKGVLDGCGLAGFPKTSGATGIHIYVPIAPRYSYPTVAGWVRSVGRFLLNRYPDLVTMERVVARRTGRVYVDYLQNVLGKTLVGPYSPRPRAGAPVSCPVTWAELETVQPADLNMTTVRERLRERGDPFAGMVGLYQSLDRVLDTFKR